MKVIITKKDVAVNSTRNATRAPVAAEAPGIIEATASRGVGVGITAAIITAPLPTGTILLVVAATRVASRAPVSIVGFAAGMSERRTWRLT